MMVFCRTRSAPGASAIHEQNRKEPMLSWALTFLIIALIAAVLGFGGIAGSAAWIAQVLFGIFIILFLVSFLFRGRPPGP
jgi:uncharacterized membrane protein YtjA (UPF0391 family)